MKIEGKIVYSNIAVMNIKHLTIFSFILNDYINKQIELYKIDDYIHLKKEA